jgi:arylsulfatase A-like enzyme
MQIRLTRRTVVTGAIATAAALTRRSAAAVPPARPNILFIMADDLGYADLSCYGRPDFQTPNLDRLAAQGMRFTQAYANSAVCSATRTALITGRYQYRIPAGLEEPIAGRDVGIPPEVPTLPSLLRGAGYQTALIGKWHLGPLPRFSPLKSGYEHFWGYRAGAVDYFTHRLGPRADLWDGDTPVEQVGYLTDLLGDHAVAAVGEFARAGKPFLISLHFSAPHWPWEGPGDVAESDRLKNSTDVEQMKDFDGGSRATYAAMVQRMDEQIGRVLDALDRLHIGENTIVVFTSDNGGERFADTWPFTGHKTELLEGGLRVPAIVRWPGHVGAGTTSDAQIITMDWLPTFVAAAGTGPDPHYPPDGIDIAAALTGGSLPERTLFWRYKNLAQRACRRGDWKYLKIREQEFLFNVVADPLERANYKARDSQRFAALKNAWETWNATMLPLDPNTGTDGFDARELADHFGVAPQDD